MSDKDVNDTQTFRVPALSLFDAGSDLVSRFSLYKVGPPIEDNEIQNSVADGNLDGSYLQEMDGSYLQESSKIPVVSSVLQCCSCQVLFDDRDTQVEHYKLDWHRYNLKRSLVSLPSVTLKEFEETVSRHQSEGAELSSISGSDDDDDDDVHDEDVVDRKRSRKDSFTTFDESSPAYATPSTDPPTSTASVYNHPKVFFQLPDGRVASLYRAFLFPKTDRGSEVSVANMIGESVEKLNDLVKNISGLKIAVILTGGGHFAAAVFHGAQVLEHKTFHRYVVRQKQGGAQSSKDSTGNAPKSAGASLRRHNEAALAKDIQVLLGETWSNLVSSCDLIFIRAPSSNRATFFSGKSPLFSKVDDRIRLIPFLTRRPTFNEVQRVFKVLTSLEIYDVDGEGEILFGKSGFPKSPPKRNVATTKITTTEPLTCVPQTSMTALSQISTTAIGSNAAPISGKMERQIAKRNRRLQNLRGQEAPDIVRSSSDDDDSDDDVDSNDVENSLTALTLTMECLDTSELKQFDCDLGDGSPSAGRRTRRKKNRGGEGGGGVTESDVDKEDEDSCLVARILSSHKNDLLTFCRTTDDEGFSKILEKCRNDLEKETSVDKEKCEIKNVEKIQSLISSLLNSSIRLGATGQFTSLLHVACQTGSGGGSGCRNEQIRFVNRLMNLGCDPAKKNGDGKTVYLSADKTIRVALRDFRSQFPDQFDYEAADIPAPPIAQEAADKAERQAERKKKLRQAKKERDKGKKEEKIEEEKRRQKEREAEEDKKRFLALSDREKRALAAEKRLATQMNRCSLCASDMKGLVPFEYLDLKFCNVKCLQEHRRKNPVG